MLIRRLFKNGNDLYLVIRKIPINNLIKKDGVIHNELFNAWKDYLSADKILKIPTHFLFCQTVEEPDWENVSSDN